MAALTPQEVLVLLAGGVTLETTDGFDVMLDGASIMSKWTAGKHNMEVEEQFKDDFDVFDSDVLTASVLPVEYALSSDPTTPPAAWATVRPPDIPAGQYLWTRYYIVEEG